MKRAILVLAACLAMQAAATAADAPSVSHREAAADLLRSIELEKTMLGGATAIADSMVEGNPMLGPYRDVLLAWASKFMNWETFGPRMIDLYVESFTEDELREMSAFYSNREIVFQHVQPSKKTKVFR